MHISVVAPSGECLRVKADMVWFADNTEHVRVVCKNTLYKLMLPFINGLVITLYLLVLTIQVYQVRSGKLLLFIVLFYCELCF